LAVAERAQRRSSPSLLDFQSGSRVIATNPDSAQSWPFHALADIAADPSRETGMIANRICDEAQESRRPEPMTFTTV
jgi:hypothetical protein